MYADLAYLINVSPFTEASQNAFLTRGAIQLTISVYTLDAGCGDEDCGLDWPMGVIRGNCCIEGDDGTPLR